MTRLLGLALALVAMTTAAAEAGEAIATAHITSQKTTHLISAVSGQQVQILRGTACVDGNGAATGLTWQDTNGTNIGGTSLVWVLNPGQCQEFRRENFPSMQPTGSGFGLDLVTTVGNGPVEVRIYTVQQ